eukprot:gene1019-1545_t
MLRPERAFGMSIGSLLAFPVPYLVWIGHFVLARHAAVGGATSLVTYNEAGDASDCAAMHGTDAKTPQAATSCEPSWTKLLGSWEDGSRGRVLAKYGGKPDSALRIGRLRVMTDLVFLLKGTCAALVVGLVPQTGSNNHTQVLVLAAAACEFCAATCLLVMLLLGGGELGLAVVGGFTLGLALRMVEPWRAAYLQAKELHAGWCYGGASTVAPLKECREGEDDVNARIEAPKVASKEAGARTERPADAEDKGPGGAKGKVAGGAKGKVAGSAEDKVADEATVTGSGSVEKKDADSVGVAGGEREDSLGEEASSELAPLEIPSTVEGKHTDFKGTEGAEVETDSAAESAAAAAEDIKDACKHNKDNELTEGRTETAVAVSCVDDSKEECDGQRTETAEANTTGVPDAAIHRDVSAIDQEQDAEDHADAQARVVGTDENRRTGGESRIERGSGKELSVAVVVDPADGSAVNRKVGRAFEISLPAKTAGLTHTIATSPPGDEEYSGEQAPPVANTRPEETVVKENMQLRWATQVETSTAVGIERESAPTSVGVTSIGHAANELNESGDLNVDPLDFADTEKG